MRSVHFEIEPVLVKGDARAAIGPLRGGGAEAGDHIGFAVALFVLQGDEEAAGRRRVIAVIAPAPGVDVDDAVRRDDEMARMADLVGENRRAEAGRQREAGVVADAGGRGRRTQGGGDKPCREM